MAYDLKVGFSCNNDCVHCVITNKINSGNLSTKKLKYIIDNDIQMNETVTVTGGEPTIRKDFIELLQYIKKKKKSKIILQTNGRAFNNENFAIESLKYVDYYLIAVHSHNKYVHDLITKKQGSWQQTVNGINILNKFKNKSNIAIQTQTVISKLNMNNLLYTFDFIHDTLNIKNMNFTFPHPNGNAYINYDIVVPKYSDMKDTITKCIEKYSNNLFLEAIPLCYVHPYVNKVFYSDGNRLLKKSNRGHDHSLVNETIDNYNEIILKEYRKPKSCEQCIYNDICIGVWKEYYEKYYNELDLYPIRRSK